MASACHSPPPCPPAEAPKFQAALPWVLKASCVSVQPPSTQSQNQTGILSPALVDPQMPGAILPAWPPWLLGHPPPAAPFGKATGDTGAQIIKIVLDVAKGKRT